MDYKLSVYGNKINKDVVITEDMEGLSLGTYKECQINFKKNNFFCDYKIEISRQDDRFTATCDGDVYFVSRQNPNIKEELTVLIPGERVEIRYQESNTTFLYLDFSFDFGNIQDNYLFVIDTPVGGNYVIGRVDNADIFVDDDRLGNDYIVYSHLGQGMYEIDLSNSKFGITVNGVFFNEKKVTLSNKQFFSLSGHIFFIEGDQLRTSSIASISTKLSCKKMEESNNALKYPRFIRSVRQRYTVPDKKLKVIAPPNKPAEPTKSYLLSLLPMIITMGGMMALRIAMGRSGIYVFYFAFFMVSSIIVSIMRMVQVRKNYKKKLVERVEKYQSYIDGKVKAIEEARAEEKLVLNKMEISADTSLDEIENFDAHLFEKEKDHSDYMCISVGQGTELSNNQIEYGAREILEVEDEYVNYPEQIHDCYEYIDDVPVMLNLHDNNAVGVIGRRDKLLTFLKNVIISLSAQHFYNDLKIFLIMDECDLKELSWVRWIKHTTDDNGKRLFIYDEESAKTGKEYLFNLLSQRENAGKKENFKDYVVLVYRSEMISGHPINRFVEDARKLGFTFVFFEEHEELINHDCDERVFLDVNQNKGYVQNVADGTIRHEFDYKELSDERVSRAAEKMAGIFIDEMSIENGLPKNVSLYDILGILNAYDLDLGKRWKESRIYESMAAPLGVRADGATISLDIHEKAHGPHGLVAGTTGSGKSEIIQSFVLSLASLFHPYEVGFIIIDFKGGGMANQFKDLPHMNGSITNIDGKQIDRSLSSIKAELLKRQELFAKYEVNHIDDYIKLFKDKVTPTPLPHLVLIVDEFAELKNEHPEFMKELISTARIGRSLGVHLILATQKPAGVVNDQIWSNSRFKLCLKVQDSRDSNEVLKSPLAAEIKEPGRAYLQVGNNELFELFQSGYSGATTHVEGLDEKSKYEINVVELDGSRHKIYEQGSEKEEGDETQLDAIIDRIGEYCELMKIEKLPPICLPPLPNKVIIPSKALTKTDDVVIDMGIYDDPAKQYQGADYLDLTQENMLIIGTSQSGKTNTLQTIIKRVADNYSPQEVSFYIMDFASTIMCNFAPLAHVADVATEDETEKVKNLLKMLGKEINRRKTLLSEYGISSYSAYRQSGKKDLPQIVFMLENYLAFKEAYPGLIDSLVEVCREGNSMGITTIVTAPQVNGISNKIITSSPKRLVLNSNDKMDYDLLFRKCKLRPDDVPGRGITQIDRNIYEIQIYQAFDAEREIDKIDQIREYIASVNARYSGYVKNAIPVVPAVYTEEFVYKNYGAVKWEPYQLLLGINYSDTAPVLINLAVKNMLAIAGQQRHTGRKSYINYIIRSLDARREQAPVEFHILDSYDRLMKDCAELESVKTYTLNPEDIDKQIDGVVKVLSKRKESIIAGNMDALDKEPLIVIVLGSSEYYTLASSSAMSMGRYRDIVNKYKSMKVAIILTDVPNASISYGANELIRIVTGFKQVLMYENVGNLKVIEPTNSFKTANSKRLKPGEMFMLKEGDLFKAKTPVWREDEI
ncbi:DNA segregation ATPase FtsK/SpoIIIE, S-DNA-T family [Butyrivibrio hungatei DSM 14810]|uniref:DNA segregation ATPase FtsK/SpoIIIE, S-DNA-T family n=1 Tax=Butyrivibrio hungatei DSM 14810 TaxID=1121132 RepID=A0A1M7RRP0_9FIRM|nr:type VII secretion protein EssC [Butyrivibrio hungatei]SHN48987.1 DNA segregation ATPase FtsK/SpoIIIE, S-DNA-T family [Butyrivibrio hungatei DSM 14810]